MARSDGASGTWLYVTTTLVAPGSYLRQAIWSPESAAVRKKVVTPPVSIMSATSTPTVLKSPQPPGLYTPGAVNSRYHRLPGRTFQVVSGLICPSARCSRWVRPEQLGLKTTVVSRLAWVIVLPTRNPVSYWK